MSDDQVVLSFFGTGGIGDVLREEHFDKEEELRLIIQRARSRNEMVSLAALRHFRQVMTQISKTSGLVARISTEQRNEDGSVTVRASRLATQPVLTKDPSYALRESTGLVSVHHPPVTTPPPKGSLQVPQTQTRGGNSEDLDRDSDFDDLERDDFGTAGSESAAGPDAPAEGD